MIKVPFLRNWILQRKRKSRKVKKIALNKKIYYSDHSHSSIVNHSNIEHMAAFFAHEFRNPLTSIIGFAQFLEQHPTVKSDPSVAQYISIIKDESVRMEILIQELLSLSPSYFDQDNLSIIDVKYLIEKVVDIYTLKVKNQNISFRTTAARDTYITGNSSRFERLLINLLTNAVEAVKSDGLVEITVSKRQGEVYISIVDSGPGIASHLIEKIFDPFYTTKDEGTGIGLSICKATVESLNGRILVKNQPPMGLLVEIRMKQYNQTSSTI